MGLLVDVKGGHQPDTTLSLAELDEPDVPSEYAELRDINLKTLMRCHQSLFISS